jgi:hypothetical protein
VGVIARLISVLGALAVVAGLAAAPVRALPVDLELVLAIDVSGSIDVEEAQLQREGYVQAFLDPILIRTIMDGPYGRIAVAYFEWSGGEQQQTVINWTLIKDPTSAHAFADELARQPISRGRFTSISGAIDYAAPMFEQNDYESNRQVIDVSGDGYNNSGRFIIFARDQAVAKRITINGLPIINDRPNPFGGPNQNRDLDVYFENCVIGGQGAFVIVANGFKEFATAVRRKLILEIAGREPEPAIRPAQARLSDCLMGERQFRQFQFRAPDVQ